MALVLSLILIPSISSLTKTYNFSSTFQGINMFAYDCDNHQNSIPPLGFPPDCIALSGDYDDVTADAGLDARDGVYQSATLNAADRYVYIYFNTSINETASDISEINWTWQGQSDDLADIYSYWYNFSSSAWVKFDFKDDIGVTGDFNITNISNNNFINGSQTNLIIFDNRTNVGSKSLKTEYVELKITYTPTVTVNLSSPNDLVSSSALLNNFVCNSSVSSGDTLNGVNLTIWNNDGTVNGSNYTVISGTTNSTNLSYTFAASGIYKWNCRVNSTSGSSAYASSNRTLTISTDAPAITLNYPNNNTYFNTNTNIYLNYTATDSNGLSQCQVWGDWTGTWHKNSTNTGVVSGSQNFTLINVSSDRVSIWNIWCNDSTNSANFSSNNFTFTTDTTYPTILLENITTTAGSQTFTFDTLATDTNLNNCFYTIYNSTGGVDPSTTANDSVSCTANDASETVSAFGTYNLTIYSNDSAGNINSTTSSFTISVAAAVGGGGGGGETLVPVIALKPLVSSTLTISPTALSELQRAILYSKIRESCLNYSKLNNCLLTIQEKNDLLNSLKNNFVVISLSELEAYIDQFNNAEVEEIEVSEVNADLYGLFKSTLQVIESGFLVFPKKLSPFFLVTSKNSEFQYEVKSNKLLKSAELVNGELGLSVELKSSSTALIKYKPQTLDFSAKTIKGTINYISEEGETVFQEVEIRALYVLDSTVIAIVIGSILVVSFLVLRRSKKQSLF